MFICVYTYIIVKYLYYLLGYDYSNPSSFRTSSFASFYKKLKAKIIRGSTLLHGFSAKFDQWRNKYIMSF